MHLCGPVKPGNIVTTSEDGHLENIDGYRELAQKRRWSRIDVA